MAEIRLTATTRPVEDGPDYPAKLWAILRDKTWSGGGTVRELELHFGDDAVTVWPADPDRVEALGRQLIELAAKLRERRVS